ncbi:hypothetical protein MIR68_000284 [Amoeboaphelidium protococcarum]|nr:hypothetical protein MIR68_000284 [Amoeboaphelidium protococcarum]
MQDQLNASELGTKDYWDQVYNRELSNFEEIADVGEIWFGEDVEDRVVDWIEENIKDTEVNIIELGCGNGHLLLRLNQIGYHNITGVDYSENGISLARQIAQSQNASNIDYGVCDILSPDLCTDLAKYDVVLDKGTFDAISLMPGKDQIDAKEIVNQYASNVSNMLTESGLFIITSCNWTREELERKFSQHLKVTGQIRHPTFKFGGVEGQVVSTVLFQKKSSNL